MAKKELPTGKKNKFMYRNASPSPPKWYYTISEVRKVWAEPWHITGVGDGFFIDFSDSSLINFCGYDLELISEAAYKWYNERLETLKKTHCIIPITLPDDTVVERKAQVELDLFIVSMTGKNAFKLIYAVDGNQ